MKLHNIKSIRNIHIQMKDVKNGDDWLRSVIYLTVLYQHQFPGFDVRLQLYRMSPLEELDERYIYFIYYFFVTLYCKIRGFKIKQNEHFKEICWFSLVLQAPENSCIQILYYYMGMLGIILLGWNNIIEIIYEDIWSRITCDNTKYFWISVQ